MTLHTTASETLALAGKGPQPGELTLVGALDTITDEETTYLRWRHVRNGVAVKEDFAEFENDPSGDLRGDDVPDTSEEARFHVFARENIGALASAVIRRGELLAEVMALVRRVNDADARDEWNQRVLLPDMESDLAALLARIDAELEK